MRVSTFKKDPGYVDYPERSIWRVYLDGELVTDNSSRRRLLTADEELGYILCNKVPDGCTIGLVLTENMEPALYIEYGTVTIVRVPDKSEEATAAAGR